MAGIDNWYESDSYQLSYDSWYSSWIEMIIETIRTIRIMRDPDSYFVFGVLGFCGIWIWIWAGFWYFQDILLGLFGSVWKFKVCVCVGGGDERESEMVRWWTISMGGINKNNIIYIMHIAYTAREEILFRFIECGSHLLSRSLDGCAGDRNWYGFLGRLTIWEYR